VITNGVSDYINLLAIIAHIIRNHSIYIFHVIFMFQQPMLLLLSLRRWWQPRVTNTSVGTFSLRC